MRGPESTRPFSAPLAGPQVRVVPLTGDASTRQYFRVMRPGNPSVVLAVYDSAFTFDELPFVNVSRLLASVPLPVPAIAGHADDLGILILEDLGDVTLQAHIGVTQPSEHHALYNQAIELIARLQHRGEELRSDEFLPFGIAFDRDKFLWELNFFVRHFLEAYRGLDIAPAARVALDQEWLEIADELAGEPRALPRDYHSRNLMPTAGICSSSTTRTRAWVPTPTMPRCCATRGRPAGRPGGRAHPGFLGLGPASHSIRPSLPNSAGAST